MTYVKTYRGKQYEHRTCRWHFRWTAEEWHYSVHTFVIISLNSNVTFFSFDSWHLSLDIICFYIGTQIYILNGTDPEGDPVRYGLSFEKGFKEYFWVDPKSGNVTLVQELDREVRLLIAWNLLEICQPSGSKCLWHLFFAETGWNLSSCEHNRRSQ